MTNKVFKFCNKVTSDPMFDAVVVFTMSFLLSGVLLEMSSALDGGVECNKYSTQEQRTFCTKLNGVFLVLAVGVPIILGISTYILAKKKRLEPHRSRKERLLHK